MEIQTGVFRCNQHPVSLVLRKFTGKLKFYSSFEKILTWFIFFSDPRQRRLAEAQQKKSEAPIPEKLTFKEKMKMFALESGENTPKDKLKISRAQRDIDAVH